MRASRRVQWSDSSRRLTDIALKDISSDVAGTGQGTNAQRSTDIAWDTTLRNPTDMYVQNTAGTTVAKTDWTYNPRGEPLTVTRTDPATGATRTSTMTYCEAAGVSAGTCPPSSAVRAPKLSVTVSTRSTKSMS